MFFKQRDMDRGLTGMDNGAALTVGVGGGVGVSNGEKGRTTVTGQQQKFKKIQKLVLAHGPYETR